MFQQNTLLFSGVFLPKIIQLSQVYNEYSLCFWIFFKKLASILRALTFLLLSTHGFRNSKCVHSSFMNTFLCNRFLLFKIHFSFRCFLQNLYRVLRFTMTFHSVHTWLSRKFLHFSQSFCKASFDYTSVKKPKMLCPTVNKIVQSLKEIYQNIQSFNILS